MDKGNTKKATIQRNHLNYFTCTVPSYITYPTKAGADFHTTFVIRCSASNGQPHLCVESAAALPTPPTPLHQSPNLTISAIGLLPGVFDTTGCWKAGVNRQHRSPHTALSGLLKGNPQETGPLCSGVLYGLWKSDQPTLPWPTLLNTRNPMCSWCTRLMPQWTSGYLLSRDPTGGRGACRDSSLMSSCPEAGSFRA